MSEPAREVQQDSVQSSAAGFCTEVWGTLTCGHNLLITDPDTDVAGSEYCGSCGCWVSFLSFHNSRGGAA